MTKKMFGKLKPLFVWLAGIGALNWGLVGLFDFNLVTLLFGSWMWLVKTLYVLIGIGGVLAIIGLFKK